MGPAETRGLAVALLLLGLAAGPARARSPGSEAELFARAEKVMLGRLLAADRDEAAPEGYPPRHGYRYQALWVKDVEVFKGPAAGHLGYEVVLLPVRERFGPRWLFPARARPATSTQPPVLLFYLVKDDQGAWTILDGVDGVFEFPGPTRLATLRAKAGRSSRSKAAGP